MKKTNSPEWWSQEYGFFGQHYMDGDNSAEGYLSSEKQSLEERTKNETEGVIRLLKLKENMSVLDAPCGYGRHSIALAKKGLCVVGSDINSDHLKKAIKDYGAVNNTLSFKQENMLRIEYQERFDAVINMFYSFGFFKKDSENLHVLRNFYNALKKGGVFLMHTDVNIPRIIDGKYKTDEIRTLSDRKTLRITDRYNPRTKRVNGSWTIIDKSGRSTTKKYSVRVYEKEEFVALCKSVGFKNIKAYSNWNGDPYSKDSEDMIITAQK